MVLDPAAPDPDEFQAAPAQIAHDTVGVGDRGQHPLARAARLLLAGQYLDLEPQRLRRRDQFAAIRRVAYRGGGDRAQRRHVHLARDRGEAGERGPCHRQCGRIDRPPSPRARDQDPPSPFR